MTTSPPRGDFDPVEVKLFTWGSYITAFDKAWNIYQRSNLFTESRGGAGMRERLRSYIIASRPFRIRRMGDRESMVEQLEKLSRSGLNEYEQYVEWVMAECDKIGGSLIMGLLSYWPYFLASCLVCIFAVSSLARTESLVMATRPKYWVDNHGKSSGQ